MKYLEQVQRGIDYIEANLETDLDLFHVSKAAAISHWHFQRIFKALTGETLKTYVRSRRMAGALESLLSTDERIVDIAMRAGFDSQEAFSRSFKRAFDVSPHAFRRRADKTLFLQKVQFNESYLRHINRNLSLEPQIFQLPPRTLVGLQTKVYGVESEKNNMGELLPGLWETFLPRLRDIKNKKGDVCYGVIASNPDSEHLRYTACTEVKTSDAEQVPSDLVVVEVTGGRYAQFAHRGPARGLNNTVNYIYSTWLAKSAERHSYGPDLEQYGSDYHPSSNESTLYYSIPLLDTA